MDTTATEQPSIAQTIAQQVGALFLDGEEVPLDAQLVGSGWMTSLNVLNLASFVTEEYGIAVDLEDVYGPAFSSVNNLAEFVEARRGEQGD